MTLSPAYIHKNQRRWRGKTGNKLSLCCFQSINVCQQLRVFEKESQLFRLTLTLEHSRRQRTLQNHIFHKHNEVDSELLLFRFDSQSLRFISRRTSPEERRQTVKKSREPLHPDQILWDRYFKTLHNFAFSCTVSVLSPVRSFLGLDYKGLQHSKLFKMVICSGFVWA